MVFLASNHTTEKICYQLLSRFSQHLDWLLMLFWNPNYCRWGRGFSCIQVFIIVLQSHSDFQSIQLSFWKSAQLERPLFTLRPKKPKMSMSELTHLAKDHKWYCRSLLPSLSLPIPHQMPTGSVLEDARLSTSCGFLLSGCRDTFPLMIQFLPCISQLMESYRE